MKLGVLRPRRHDDPKRYADWQQAVRRLAQERVTQSEATTILNAARTYQELFLAARDAQDTEELDFHAFLEQAMSPSRALQSLRWLSNNGRLQWQLDRLKPEGEVPGRGGGTAHAAHPGGQDHRDALQALEPVQPGRSAGNFSMATATRGSRPTTGRDVRQPVSPTVGTGLTSGWGAGAGEA